MIRRLDRMLEAIACAPVRGPLDRALALILAACCAGALVCLVALVAVVVTGVLS